ncbi:hypothetical protein J1C67_00035 [Clostridium gasigenes]|uniref:hypothetical protein n=1 Tax=Clostridium gasigenes TaxID=94869 RepID=UPI001438616B|nr:hypothetical protein [Clostridium gasigenes]NKF07114.1 hypothetical protein [Clostridium gasigenes]QSW19635.1 hypothetical protein J1C67_00035 [Clostridium gasigenes]
MGELNTETKIEELIREGLSVAPIDKIEKILKGESNQVFVKGQINKESLLGETSAISSDMLKAAIHLGIKKGFVYFQDNAYELISLEERELAVGDSFYLYLKKGFNQEIPSELGLEEKESDELIGELEVNGLINQVSKISTTQINWNDYNTKISADYLLERFEILAPVLCEKYLKMLSYVFITWVTSEEDRREDAKKIHRLVRCYLEQKTDHQVSNNCFQKYIKFASKKEEKYAEELLLLRSCFSKDYFENNQEHYEEKRYYFDMNEIEPKQNKSIEVGGKNGI